jgi:fucose permease
MLDAPAARRALWGFFLSGLIISFLGAILPAWGYHLKSNYSVIGLYFFCLNSGVLVSVRTARALLVRKGVPFVLTLSSGLACAAFLFLALVSGPVADWWRMSGLFWLGLSAGMVNTAVFHSISDIYRHDRAATLNLAGAFFGLGCLLTAILVAGTFYIYTVPSILVLFAVIPGMMAGMYARCRLSADLALAQPSLRAVFADFRSPMAILLSLLLFFHFGNEWAVAGWLPVFLIQRLGVSPASSLWLLAIYWLALIVGRFGSQALGQWVNHRRLLFSGVVSALLGCIFLTTTNNLSGAFVGILLVGFGFAPIYPLVAERIGDQFPYYHPGFFNGIFSFAILGGLAAPWMLGHFADIWGVGVVMFLPFAGSCAVTILVLLIWLEAKLSKAPGVS